MLPTWIPWRCVRRMLRLEISPVRACRGLAHPMQALGPVVTNSMVHICSACRPRLSASAKWALGQSWGQPRLGIVNSLLLGPGHPLSRYEEPGTGRGRSEVSVVALRLGQPVVHIKGRRVELQYRSCRGRASFTLQAPQEKTKQRTPTLPERLGSPVPRSWERTAQTRACRAMIAHPTLSAAPPPRSCLPRNIEVQSFGFFRAISLFFPSLTHPAQVWLDPCS